jgi:predicted RNA methylase
MTVRPEWRGIAMSTLPAAIKRRLRAGARVRILRPLLRRLYLWKRRGDPANRPHPIDLRYGIETGGELANLLLGQQESAARHITGYLGCVPSVLRTALRTIPDVSRTAFVDLGCGKGRALVVATEFPFVRVVGVELDEHLVRIAMRNAEAIAAAFPERPPIEIEAGDASELDLPEGGAVVFLYHPFGVVLVRRVAERLAAHSRIDRPVFVVYENPIFGAVFDEHPAFRRWFAATLPRAAEETALGGAPTETVMVWLAGAPEASPHATAGRLVVNERGNRADVV